MSRSSKLRLSSSTAWSTNVMFLRGPDCKQWYKCSITYHLYPLTLTPGRTIRECCLRQLPSCLLLLDPTRPVWPLRHARCGHSQALLSQLQRHLHTLLESLRRRRRRILRHHLCPPILPHLSRIRACSLYTQTQPRIPSQLPNTPRAEPKSVRRPETS